MRRILMDTYIRTIKYLGYIEIILHCEYTYELGELIIKNALEVSKIYETNKVLLTGLNIFLPKNTMNRFMWGSNAAEAWRGKLKMAFLVDNFHELTFVANVFYNRGGYGKRFTNREKAIEWLLS